MSKQKRVRIEVKERAFCIVGAVDGTEYARVPLCDGKYALKALIREQKLFVENKSSFPELD